MEMRRAFAYLPGISRKVQRRNVLLLTLAMCLWMIMSAAHIHAGDGHDAPGKTSAACAVCLSLPSGAAAPAQYTSPMPVWLAGWLLADRIVSPPVRNVSSFYLSRAPPAF
jgi:hypothetical protein